jgi:hypothetical protein
MAKSDTILTIRRDPPMRWEIYSASTGWPLIVRVVVMLVHQRARAPSGRVTVRCSWPNSSPLISGKAAGADNQRPAANRIPRHSRSARAGEAAEITAFCAARTPLCSS